MTKRTWLLITILIAGHLVVDLIAPHVMIHPEPDWLLAGMLGLCVGQITLIGVWAAMAPGRVILRLPWGMLLAALMWYALVLGNQTRGLFQSPWAGFDAEDALLLGLILLAGVVVAQIPLWIASRLLGWRITPPQSTAPKAIDERQFNIKHLIASMLIVSVALGLGRDAMPSGEWRLPGLHGELTILFATVAVVNLIVAVPCIWGAFAHWKWVMPLAILWIFYALIVSILEVGTLSALLGSPLGDSELWLFVTLLTTLFNLAECLTVFGTLAVLRLIGFRLIRIHSPKPAATP